MKQVVLNIPDNEYPFFMKVIENFHFVKVERKEEGNTKEEILEGIKEGLEQVKLYKQGKIKLKSAKDLLDEL